ncbi:MAG: hypothetical protein AAGN35_15515 [Bacteroidota bacterium]
MAKRKSAKRTGGRGWKYLLWPFRIALAIVLPFVVLIRVSVFCYAALEWNHWLALFVGAALTFLLIFFYLTRISRLIWGKKKADRRGPVGSLRISLVIVGGFCLYALLYLSAGNAKTASVADEYTSTHPLLRLAVSTLTIFDRDLVITDMSRSHADYDDMGLSRKRNSLHYPQADGYVHAIDLRTRDRAEWRNSALQWYFELMGFGTLRHVGTGDHLHVSLLIRENPAAR